ncbi:Alpha/Beta hydrolase protein [Multifurca ochricompacta]|uniref:Alpha/Beta hydrolase protein n=1 Tax=Multifurca ochricompacta TaxID=376703 RepID=A0AAD4QMV9_9AGAM|nr:Alpha/Beta hydrolase protein [Multifurca ochricompacta]
MSPSPCCVRLSFLRNRNHLNLKYRGLNDTRSKANAGTSASPFLFSTSIPNALRTAGFLLQPSADPPSGWLALSAFVGLPLVLWAYKCLMLVLFQRKVIYMGYAPPGSRTESLKDVYPKNTLKGIHVEELSIPSYEPDTVRLSTLLLRHERDLASPPHHVIVYFQGNAGNPLHRIPIFATLLNAIPFGSLAILAPAPRSYWTSTRARPTQAGLIADYTAALAFAANRFPKSRLTIYGHSLGASIALCLLSNPGPGPGSPPISIPATVHGLVLENAFTSVPDMLRALYPNRWLPYQYLGPFVRDRWDARTAAAAAVSASAAGANVTTEHTHSWHLARRAMVLVSARDEVVPPVMGQEIFDELRASVDGDGGGGSEEGLGRLVVLQGALHENAWRYRDWVRAMKEYLGDLEREPIR